ncbi:MAG: hypothetical protein Q7J48_17415 [Nocardioides sp.]|nr:hypothetical protein [Nocardioides sp.]
MFGAQDFDPYGSTGEEFINLFWSGIEDAIDEDYFDEDRLMVKANPDGRYKKTIVIRHKARGVPALVPPTYQVAEGDIVYSVWFVPSADTEALGENGKPKQYNLFLMVRNAYAFALKGDVSDIMPNPYFFGRGLFNAEVSLLSAMRARLKDADMWGGAATMGVEFASAGGSSESLAAREAKRRNAATARAARALKIQHRDAEILAAASTGLGIADLAETFCISEQSVKGALARVQ